MGNALYSQTQDPDKSGLTSKESWHSRYSWQINKGASGLYTIPEVKTLKLL